MISTIKNKLLLIFTGILTSLQLAAMEVSLVYIGDEENSAYLGARQGLDEANLMGNFLGHQYTLDSITADELDGHDLSAYSVVLTAVQDADGFANIAASVPDHAVFNLTIKDNALREACIPNAFHTLPSLAMYADAEKQYLSKNPQSAARAQGWHPDFVKFAARDLNKRYKASSGRPMDDMAYAGWAAVKLTSDTVARTSSKEPAVLMDYFKTSLKFDGQKGSDMNFRETGQLRQLMLLVEENKIVAEAPVRGVASSLDSLGLLTCAK